jgi:hypothetical protein
MISQVRHLLSYILYLSRNSNVIVITRPNLGWYRFGLSTDLWFIVGKSRYKLCSTMVLVLVGMISQVRHLLSYILYLSRNFNIITTRPNLDWYRSGLIANFVFIVFKSRHQFCSRGLVLVGMISQVWHLLSYILYLSRNFNIITTRPNLDWYRSDLIANFVFIVFKSRHQLCSRVLVLVGMISQVWHLLSYILYLSRNFNIWSQLDPI